MQPSSAANLRLACLVVREGDRLYRAGLVGVDAMIMQALGKALSARLSCAAPAKSIRLLEQQMSFRLP
jgi:hypothetical protein